MTTLYPEPMTDLYSSSTLNNVSNPILVRLEVIEMVRAISREHTDCKLACIKGTSEEKALLEQHIAVLENLLTTARATLSEV